MSIHVFCNNLYYDLPKYQIYVQNHSYTLVNGVVMSRSHPLANQTGYGYQLSTVQWSVRDEYFGSLVSPPKR